MASLILVEQKTALIIALVSLTVTLIARLFGSKRIKCIPILMGAIAGYIACYCFGIIDFTAVSQASWFALPAFCDTDLSSAGHVFDDSVGICFCD